MTEENKRQNIQEEMERAHKAMEAADLLFDRGLLNDAVSRLYYFLLHYLRALLLTKELEPKSHESALRLFALHFVKQGPFESRDSHIFSKLMKYREEADYNPSYSFTTEDFTEFRQEAQRLCAGIATYLKEKGYS